MSAKTFIIRASVSGAAVVSLAMFLWTLILSLVKTRKVTADLLVVSVMAVSNSARLIRR